MAIGTLHQNDGGDWDIPRDALSSRPCTTMSTRSIFYTVLLYLFLNQISSHLKLNAFLRYHLRELEDSFFNISRFSLDSITF